MAICTFVGMQSLGVWILLPDDANFQRNSVADSFWPCEHSQETLTSPTPTTHNHAQTTRPLVARRQLKHVYRCL